MRADDAWFSWLLQLPFSVVWLKHPAWRAPLAAACTLLQQRKWHQGLGHLRQGQSQPCNMCSDLLTLDKPLDHFQGRRYPPAAVCCECSECEFCCMLAALSASWRVHGARAARSETQTSSWSHHVSALSQAAPLNLHGYGQNGRGWLGGGLPRVKRGGAWRAVGCSLHCVAWKSCAGS